MLKVKGRKMNLEKIPLKTVRQFYIQDVVLADFEDQFTPDTPQVVKKVENLCFAKVRRLKHIFLLFFFQLKQPSIFSSLPLTVFRSQRWWKRLRENDSAALAPQRSLSSA